LRKTSIVRQSGLVSSMAAPRRCMSAAFVRKDVVLAAAKDDVPGDPFGANTNLASLARGYYWTAGVVMVLAMLIGLFEGVGVGLLIPLKRRLTLSIMKPRQPFFELCR
jgi:hypothetical protein